MKKAVSFILFLIAWLDISAQPVFSTEVDTNRILIGEQINLLLYAELEARQDFEWPVLPDTITGLEIVKVKDIDTSSENGRWIIEQNLVLTSFDSGYATIPPLRFQAGDESSTSQAIGIAVHLPEVSEAEDYYDIKAPLEPPFDWWPVVFTILALLVLGLLVFLVIRYTRRRRLKARLSPEESLSPYDYAQLQIRGLQEEKLWQNGHIKEYYSRLTDILRLYMERQMGINAMESTADEVVEKAQRLNLSHDLKENIRDLMRLSVLVKFAKQTPGPGEHENSLKTVENFLQQTKPREELASRE